MKNKKDQIEIRIIEDLDKLGKKIFLSKKENGKDIAINAYREAKNLFK